MNARRVIMGALAVALGLWIAVTAADGDLDGEHSPPIRSVGRTGGRLSHGSSGAAVPRHPGTRRHPRLQARVRTYPRLTPQTGSRNSVFTVAFRLRRNLGPHGRRSAYYGVVVAPLAGHPRHGCYGFGRYVTKGHRAQIVRVALHPRGRRWCRGTYEAGVYLTARPSCQAQPSRPQACSTAAYPAIPTGWASFTVR